MLVDRQMEGGNRTIGDLWISVSQRLVHRIDATHPRESMAIRVVQSRPAAVIAAFQSLAQGGRRRLLRRLVQLPEEHTGRFWSWLFHPEGTLGTFEAVLGNPEVFRTTAAATFPRSAAIVHESLKGLSLEQRRALEGDARRALASSLQELMASATTADAAFRALALLAEAETEKYGNPCPAVFRLPCPARLTPYPADDADSPGFRTCPLPA